MVVQPPVTLDLEFMLAAAALAAIVPSLVACWYGRRLVTPVVLCCLMAMAGVVLVTKTAFPWFCGVIVWLGGSAWVAMFERRKRLERGRQYEITTSYLD
ncbi:hypothetical protein GVN21_00195 [Caulobacter sp. SLTY]|uniref:hypothetical protein n=1 Tax=Caulobacter sp. SLTY TaxID=2683262 RepID=UPI0014124BE0|nr:hypothetical protein [Caulobacter sp. SLTY]NBB13771.1 hypothetical protein [Caulobacter sp. SLTY]